MSSLQHELPFFQANHAQSVSILLHHPFDRPGMSFSASPAKAQPNTTQKIRKTSNTTSLSTSKPGFVPAKSTKATTTSSFTLPGEAIAAKLKAQREERQKREEEAAAKEAGKKVVARSTTAIKARPRLSTMRRRPSSLGRRRPVRRGRVLWLLIVRRGLPVEPATKRMWHPRRLQGSKRRRVQPKAKELAAKKTSGANLADGCEESRHCGYWVCESQFGHSTNWHQNFS